MVSCGLLQNSGQVLKKRTALVAAVTAVRAPVGAEPARAEDPNGGEVELLMTPTRQTHI